MNSHIAYYIKKYNLEIDDASANFLHFVTTRGRLSSPRFDKWDVQTQTMWLEGYATGADEERSYRENN